MAIVRSPVKAQSKPNCRYWHPEKVKARSRGTANMVSTAALLANRSARWRSPPRQASYKWPAALAGSLMRHSEVAGVERALITCCAEVVEVVAAMACVVAVVGPDASVAGGAVLTAAAVEAARWLLISATVVPSSATTTPAVAKTTRRWRWCRMDLPREAVSSTTAGAQGHKSDSLRHAERLRDSSTRE